MRGIASTLLLFAFLTAWSPCVAGEALVAEKLFRRAEYMEKIVGDLDCASRLYASLGEGEGALAAEALYREARCELKSGDMRAAVSALDAALKHPACDAELKRKVEQARLHIEESVARIRAQVTAPEVQRRLNALADAIEAVESQAAHYRKMGKDAPTPLDRPAATVKMLEILARLPLVPADRTGAAYYLAETEFEHGYNRFRADDYAAAKPLFESALVFRPDYADAREFLKIARYICGEIKSDSDVVGTGDRRPGMPDIKLRELRRLARLGKEQLNSGEHEKALELFETALDLARWSTMSFRNSAEVQKQVGEIHSQLPAVFRWLNPREASRLTALRDERDQLIDRFAAAARNLLNAVQAGGAAEKNKPEPADSKPRAESVVEIADTPALPRSVRIAVRIIRYRSGFLERAGLDFEPVSGSKRPFVTAAADANSFAYVIRRAGEDAEWDEPVFTNVAPDGNASVRIGRTLPYIASYEPASVGKNVSRPMLEKVFEGVVVTLTDADEGRMRVNVRVEDVAGMERVRTQHGIVEVPRVTCEEVTFVFEPVAGKMVCAAPFANPSATGSDPLAGEAGKTVLAVCVTAVAGGRK